MDKCNPVLLIESWQPCGVSVSAICTTAGDKSIKQMANGRLVRYFLEDPEARKTRPCTLDESV